MVGGGVGIWHEPLPLLLVSAVALPNQCGALVPQKEIALASPVRVKLIPLSNYYCHLYTKIDVSIC